MLDKKEIDAICEEIISCSIEVHKILGPGLLEKAYQKALAREFDLRNISYELEYDIVAEYKGALLDTVYRCDILVKDTVLVEIKSVDTMIPKYTSQAITYVSLSRKPAGLLINFNETRLVDGIKRIFPLHSALRNLGTNR